MRYLVIETELFYTDIPDDQLGHWFIGGDCAGWFYARLLPHEDIRQYLDPTMEDWGWIMAVRADGVVVDVCVWEYLNQQKQWVLGIAGKKRFLKKVDPDLIRKAERTVEVALRTIVERDDRFSKAKWFDHDPMEKRISSMD